MSLFFIVTLGCKVNQYESQALREAWLALGLAEARAPEEASFILLNSCAVTAKAVADVRNAVRRLHRAAPGAAIVVTGCAAEPQAEELAALPGVVRIVPQADKADLKKLVPEALSRFVPKSPEAPPSPLHQELSSLDAPFPPSEAKRPSAAVKGDGGSPFPQRTSGRSHGTAYPDFSVTGYERSRAVLKIQDGCSHGCAYCIVPLTRGGARSRPFADSLAEARRLLQAGFAEIVISGINLRQYTQEGGGFWEFLSGLDAALAPEWAGRARFRLSSLEPGQLGPRALETLASARMLAPHLHLSLQSGSSSVLRRMGRGHYDPGLLPDFLARLRRIWPVFGLGADILTGFPGETEDEFAEGLDFVSGLGLSYAHVFPYSKRPGTRAAALPGQVPQGLKKERAARLRDVAARGKADFLRSLARLPELNVVFEDRGQGQKNAVGVCEYYADCRLSGFAGVLPRGLTRVRPAGAEGETLLVARAPESACD